MHVQPFYWHQLFFQPCSIDINYFFSRVYHSTNCIIIKKIYYSLQLYWRIFILILSFEFVFRGYMFGYNNNVRGQWMHERTARCTTDVTSSHNALFAATCCVFTYLDVSTNNSKMSTETEYIYNIIMHD